MLLKKILSVAALMVALAIPQNVNASETDLTTLLPDSLNTDSVLPNNDNKPPKHKDKSYSGGSSLFGPSSSFAMDPFSAVIGPLMDMVKEVLPKDLERVKQAAIKLVSKSTRCKMCNKTLACKVGITFSGCKSDCQTVVQQGGYELRLRFSDDWSIIDCVRKGVEKGLQTRNGKGNPKSIAIYSAYDLERIMGLIAIRMAAEKVALTGQLPQPKNSSSVETLGMESSLHSDASLNDMDPFSNKAFGDDLGSMFPKPAASQPAKKSKTPNITYPKDHTALPVLGRTEVKREAQKAVKLVDKYLEKLVERGEFGPQ